MLVALAALVLSSAAPVDALQASFQNPPPSARPHTWWHWMNGNVTKVGITKDLEAMKEAGIGGAQMFTVDQSIPAGPAGYNGKLWRELTAWAVKEADRLGIELCIHNCAGWSSSGGPWIKPEDAMQVLAWSTTEETGGGRISAVLPPIQAPQVYAKVDYAKDIAVYAIQGQSGIRFKPNDFLARTGVVRGDGLLLNFTPNIETLSKIVDVTDHFSNGRLEWDAPEGEWTILRLGHVPTGKDNHPAPPEGDGLEVDKLSKAALEKHWMGLMANVVGDAGPLAGKSLNNALIDSYEVGSQNWTPLMREDFKRLRGYDPMPYLPVIAGFTVGSPEISERFLWDWRRTIADLYATNYYQRFTELCHSVGMVASSEPYGNGGFDNIQAGSKADIPMGEFWIPGGMASESVKLAASVAHVYGKPVVGAESFTASEMDGAWKEEPAKFKALGDLMYTYGLNRYIFHRYAMQPWTDKLPGMTMGPWGSHIDRTQTWWREAASWLKYVARCQSVLQQGRFVADVLYYYGENAPVDMPNPQDMRQLVPQGFDYDGCDAGALMSAKVVDGHVVLPSGAKYRVLMLSPSKYMTPLVASKVADLVRDGATVVGQRPEDTPSLVNYPSAGLRVKEIGESVWGAGELPVSGNRKVGQGQVYWGTKLGTVFSNFKMSPDFDYSPKNYFNKLVYCHRVIGDADVYFVSNQGDRWVRADASFRLGGKQPELWHPETGKVEDAVAFGVRGSMTTVPLTLGPTESVFVVFRKPISNWKLATFKRDMGEEKAPPPPRVEIIQARYQSADGRGADVTEKVQELVNRGDYVVPANNSLFGDPVVNVVKHLMVRFKVDGVEKTVTAPENGLVELVKLKDNSMPFMEDVHWNNGRLELTAWAAGNFVGKGLKGETFRFKAPAPQTLDVTGSWNLTFPPNLGAPAQATFASLVDWTKRPEDGIKYFSGRATYHKTLTVPAAMVASGRALRLDLGEVKNFATLRVNGKTVGVLWKGPWQFDVTGYVKAGKNEVEIDVTNLWPNRLIGDEQLPPDAEFEGNHLKKWPDWLVKGEPRPKTGRITFATWRYFTKDSPLLPSGLLGPVKLLSAKTVVVPVR